MKYDFYGIGNPLIDILISAEDKDLSELGIKKGTMELIDQEKRALILEYFKASKIKYACGGACPNTMITLSGLGAKTALGGKVGNDEYGTIYKTELKNYKNLYSSIVEGEGTTGSSIILISPDFERSMNTYLGINREFSHGEVDENILENSFCFYFTGYMWDTENQKEAISKALDICKTKNIKVAFDLADPFAVGRYKDDFLTLIKNNCDVVFANKQEAEILFSESNPEKCVSLLAEMGCIAAVKNGKHGSFIKDNKNEITSVPILNDAGCLDTTGAGDIYSAGFLYGYKNKKSMEISGSYASIAASAIVSKIGARFTDEELSLLKQKIC